MNENDEFIVNDSSENSNKQNNATFGEIFCKNLALCLSILALAVLFFARFLMLCDAYGVGAWFAFIAMGLVFAAVILECLKYIKTKELNLKSDTVLVVAIALIVAFF